MNKGTMTHNNKDLTRRLEEAENCFKVYGFSHVIIMRSVVDLVDVSLRKNIDCMFRKTKSYCKNDIELELYRQQLCKLYLKYTESCVAVSDRLEPELSRILRVEVERTPGKAEIHARVCQLRTRVAEMTTRIQSLLALQNRMNTEAVMAEWVFSKVEPIVFQAELDLANMKYVSSDKILSVLSSVSRMKNAFHALEI